MADHGSDDTAAAYALHDRRMLESAGQTAVVLTCFTMKSDYEEPRYVSGATPKPTVKRRHQMTALWYAERSVPAGTS